MKKIGYIMLFLSLLIVSACSINKNCPSNKIPLIPLDSEFDNNLTPAENQSKVNKIIENMTLEEKIAQIFIVRPDAMNPNLTSDQINDAMKYGVIEFDEIMQQELKKYPVGGVALFGKNIASPTQLTSFIDSMQQQSSISLFIGIDEEGGTVSRIAKSENFAVPKFESMQIIGETQNVKNAQNVGQTIGSYLKKYGFNLDFAPVADINTNPDNIVIGDRSFGNDPDLVAEMVAAEILGLHNSGIMSCVKHFPGHGDTKSDTHTEYVIVDKTWGELKMCELIPFINSLDTTDMVMISHISTPNITEDELPASLSTEMIEGKLRKELGYKGVVISDSMSMGAITEVYSSSDSAVKAILAGTDIILMPENFVDAYNGIYNAVITGVISESRIDESLLRILSLKVRYNLI